MGHCVWNGYISCYAFCWCQQGEVKGANFQGTLNPSSWLWLLNDFEQVNAQVSIRIGTWISWWSSWCTLGTVTGVPELEVVSIPVWDHKRSNTVTYQEFRILTRTITDSWPRVPLIDTEELITVPELERLKLLSCKFQTKGRHKSLGSLLYLEFYVNINFAKDI